MEKYHIKNQYTSSKWWFEVGRMEKKDRSVRQLTRQFRKCFFRCRIVLNGKLYQCPRSAHGDDLGFVYTPRSDHYPLIVTDNMEDLQTLRKKRLEMARYFYRRDYISACDHCNIGVETKIRTVPAGEQMSR